jgi:hypothetical protein
MDTPRPGPGESVGGAWRDVAPTVSWLKWHGWFVSSLVGAKQGNADFADAFQKRHRVEIVAGLIVEFVVHLAEIVENEIKRQRVTWFAAMTALVKPRYNTFHQRVVNGILAHDLRCTLPTNINGQLCLAELFGQALQVDSKLHIQSVMMVRGGAGYTSVAAL